MWEDSAMHYEKNRVIKKAGLDFVPYREFNRLTVKFLLHHFHSRTAFERNFANKFFSKV